ncbi:hypothetical protein BD413DRAFT_303499 [Trametes elegans]|nr:hypothetical protein BD413DRAFT_303499 [Trametes elegans]
MAGLLWAVGLSSSGARFLGAFARYGSAVAVLGQKRLDSGRVKAAGDGRSTPLAGAHTRQLPSRSRTGVGNRSTARHI